jgi:hypothetical protein
VPPRKAPVSSSVTGAYVDNHWRGTNSEVFGQGRIGWKMIWGQVASHIGYRLKITTPVPMAIPAYSARMAPRLAALLGM